MSKKFWNLSNETAEILIYGQISDESWYEDEITPKKFAEDLKTFGSADLTVRINSQGGDVFAAQAIYNQLKLYSGVVNVVIDGICASAATIIACAGDKVTMPVNSIFMIHNPSTIMLGAYDSTELEKISKALATIKQTIINVYQSKNNNFNAKKLSKMMDDETYLTAEEAKNYGFVDEISGERLKLEDRNGKIFINSLAIDTKYLKKPAEFENIINGKVKRMDEKSLFQNFKNWLDSKMTNDNEVDAVEGSEIEKAKAAERQRMIALDSLKTGNEIIDKYIEAAKVQGEGAEKAEYYVNKMIEVMKTQNSGIDELRKFVADNLKSGAEGIKNNLAEQPNDKESAINEMVKFMNQNRGARK